MVEPWSTHGRRLVDPSSTDGRPGSTHGRSMVDTWSTHSRPMVGTCILHTGSAGLGSALVLRTVRVPGVDAVGAGPICCRPLLGPGTPLKRVPWVDAVGAVTVSAGLSLATVPTRCVRRVSTLLVRAARHYTPIPPQASAWPWHSHSPSWNVRKPGVDAVSCGSVLGVPHHWWSELLKRTPLWSCLNVLHLGELR